MNDIQLIVDLKKEVADLTEEVIRVAAIARQRGRAVRFLSEALTVAEKNIVDNSGTDRVKLNVEGGAE
tara:strand:- start:21296 stop:21499 length:204 start_codon:yes stop_codon:yes gene_type:complete